MKKLKTIRLPSIFRGRNVLDRGSRMKIYDALIHGSNWDVVRRFIDENEFPYTVRISASGETALIVAIKGGNYSFIKKLVDSMSPKSLDESDDSFNTALHAAALLGNVKVARLLLGKKRELLRLNNGHGLYPVQLAANRGHKEMASYLLTATMEDEFSSAVLKDPVAKVLESLLKAGFYDLAHRLVDFYPELAWEGICPLELMAEDPSAFPSGTDLGILGSLIYSLCPETPGRLWKILQVLVPPMKLVYHTKLKHHQTLQLVKLVCSIIKSLEDYDATLILERPFLLGAQNGVAEIVAEILDSFPHSIDFTDEEKHSVFHLAVMYRCQNVFKVLREKNIEQGKMFVTDEEGNNILHLVGYRARQDLLGLKRGAILQMQYELRWFKEVERLLTPKEIKSKNDKNKTPLAIFNEEHADLAAKEIQWMTGMATACSVAASLIVTVAFAAAITVPGGNDSDGFPIFSDRTSFLVFSITDSLALVSAITSVLSFVSIFTSRYGVNDFLNTLPSRLIIGLISLIFSVMSLMVAFITTIFLVFAKNNALILIPIIAVACAPVIFYIKLQLPPLLNMINSTYGPGLFGE